MARTVSNADSAAHFVPLGGTDPTVVDDGAGGTVTAAVGVLSTTVDAKGQLVFFWHNTEFVGWNLDYRIFTVETKPNGDGAIEVDYSWLRPGEAVACCASGFQAVTYHWDGSAMHPDQELSKEIRDGQTEVHLTP